MLSETDIRHIQAAEGWLALGLPAEAQQEIDNIDSEHRTDPYVLTVQMHAHYAAAKWEECLQATLMLIQVVPENPYAYTSGSIALYRLNRTQEAWDFLVPVLDRFKDVWTIPYNLACYAAQLGNRKDARVMFDLALDRGDAAEVKEHALEDPDLKPIWLDIMDD